MGIDMYYKLNEAGWPVVCTLEEYLFNDRRQQHVGDDTVLGLRVSTIFMALDFSAFSPIPILFETMIFGNGESKWGRYAYWKHAWVGHQYAVEFILAKRLLPPPLLG